eukprot:TRINITY_DN2283_c0_g1_i4.p1 TRINITY_DN2283_c0_g1~~TRINITY_DN2283_c0_g1_i4.p1  ORF type:complete len:485 (-),score=58.79 TRINITY_DN2283_c0_g1_i4:299-1708(-)
MQKMSAIVLVWVGVLSAVVLGADRSVSLLVINKAKADPETEFFNWVLEHNKGYINNAEEYDRRYKVWLENLEYVHGYNSDEKSHWLGLNSLADLTLEEYSQFYLGYDPNSDVELKSELKSSDCKYCSIPIDDLPKDVDFRKKGVVTNVKNQEQCGSCWAFSSIAAVESVNAIYGEPLVSLSEQELMDCDYHDHACQGGLMDFAFQFIIENNGIDTFKDYPYLAEDERCNVNKEHRDIVTIQSYQDVPKNNETALMQAAANQVISIAIQANQRPFQLYSGGVFDDECGTSLDHGVVIVGYGVEDESGVSYWIVRNSWGPQWGDSGYIKMRKDIASPEGICGLAMQPSFPIKSEPNPPKPSPSPPSPPPSPPTPGPTPNPGVECDNNYRCNEGTTCCCRWQILDYCLDWGCCPIANGVCCEDHVHCCPANTECDLENDSCVNPQGQLQGLTPWESLTQPLMSKQPAFLQVA